MHEDDEKRFLVTVIKVSECKKKHLFYLVHIQKCLKRIESLLLCNAENMNVHVHIFGVCWNRTCLGYVNRRGERITRPLWPPTSCTWWDSTPASWGPTGGSSKRSSTSCLSSCMVCGILSNIWALLIWLKFFVPCYICCMYEDKCWYHTIFLQQKHMMVYKIWLVTLLSRSHRSVEGILCKFRWEK